MDSLQTFQSHVQRLAKEWGFTRQQLSDTSKVAYSIVGGILNGTHENLTLKTMQSIADALGIPLSLMLKPLDSDEWQTILKVAKYDTLNRSPILPPDYTILNNVILPCHKAAIVMEWVKMADKEFDKLMREKRSEEIKRKRAAQKGE